jgi:hypothetical protein
MTIVLMKSRSSWWLRLRASQRSVGGASSAPNTASNVDTYISVSQPSTHNEPSQLPTESFLGGDPKPYVALNRGKLRVLIAAVVASPKSPAGSMAGLNEDRHELFSYSEDPWKPTTSDEDLKIRLIELYPSGQQALTAPLQCRLFWTSLTTHIPFKALSYTWGTDPPSGRVTMQNTYLPITPSLETALQHVRHETESVTIWVDQISINQSDDDEKNEQVANMYQIYQAAIDVIIWLGPAADGSDELFDTWNQISRMAYDVGFLDFFDNSVQEGFKPLLRIMTRADPQDRTTVEFHRVVDRVANMMDESTLKSWTALERRPWFSRIWVRNFNPFLSF